MKAIYQVETRHSEQMLKDFIKFRYKVLYPKSAYRLSVMAVGFILIGLLARGHSLPITVGGLVLGGLLLLLVVFRKQLALGRLKRSDPLYRHQEQIVQSFGAGEFIIENTTEGSRRQFNYTQVSGFYKDRRNLFLVLDNEELQVLPLADVVSGESEQLADFLFHKTAKQPRDLALPLKERIRLMNEARKEAERLHDQKIAEKKNKKKS